MAAPGVGIRDLVDVCRKIHELAIRYKDAPKEFDEIAEKSKSLEVVLKRIDTEATISGNLVDRAGPEAYGQLEENLKSLRRDSEKLKGLVKKYDTIHDEGPGRRFLFAMKESKDLSDLRRRIGLHEQMLQLWYMTLVYGSLRRLEGGQEEILKALDIIKRWDSRKREAVRASLVRGNHEPLTRELQKAGLKKDELDVSLKTAATFIKADKSEQESIIARCSSVRPKSPPYGSLRPTPQFVFENVPGEPNFDNDLKRHRSYSARNRRGRTDYDPYTKVVLQRDDRPEPSTRRRSSRSRPQSYHQSSDDIEGSVVERRAQGPLNYPPPSSKLVTRESDDRPVAGSGQPSEQNLELRRPSAPHLVVPDTTRRSSRSSSRHSSRSESHDDNSSTNSSTHSYDRRRRSSSSRRNVNQEVEIIRKITPMDRIDSIDL